MAEEMKLALAKENFATLCGMLDKHQWKYQTAEDSLSVSCKIQGEDVPIELSIEVDAERMLTILLSHLPMVVPEDKRLDMAIAISTVNNSMVMGCFDYNITDGHIFFRMASSFEDSKISEEVFGYLVYCSCQIIDAFNDKLLMLAKGLMSIEDFLKSLMNQ